MATFMSSAFTVPDGRKKVVTYGKSSKLARIPLPTLENDATSPERPRKHNLSSNSLSKKRSAFGANGDFNNVREDTTSSDVFDVPSDDEFALPSSKPAKRTLTKRRVPNEDHNVHTPNEEAPGQALPPMKVNQALHKSDKAHSVATAAKTSQILLPPLTGKSASESTTDDALSFRPRRRETPQSIQEHTQERQDRQTAVPTSATGKGKENTRAKPFAISTASKSKSKKTASGLPLSAIRVEVSTKPSQEPDVFGMPSSGDEAHLPTPKPLRRGPISVRKEPEKVGGPSRAHIARDLTESEDSGQLKVRKRKRSTLSLTAPKMADMNDKGPSLPQRSRKHQKKEDSVSPRCATPRLTSTTKVANAQPDLIPINKPKRTRIRTVPVVTKAPIAKGQSSPAALHSMLPRRQAPQPSPIAEQPEVTALEDDTMYDIPDSLATPVRRTTNPGSGSVTPRQKALFGSLLGSSSSSATPMPSISRLQLTDRKPSSLLGALSRSRSDLTYGAESRKVKLLAKLKPEEESSEDDTSGSESGSGSEEELKKHSAVKTSAKSSSAKGPGARSLPDFAQDAMDFDVEVDGETPADSQTSQATSAFGARTKFTYAKSRSYLQEANPEDALLMSMDLDDPITFSQMKDSQTEDDEDSQARPIHELKRRGQNNAFQWDNEMLIGDIGIQSSNSIRRSTMLELCTKMADQTFAHDLLDSSLDQQFLKNLRSNGEIIFDFAVAVATAFMLRANPTSAILGEIFHSHAMDTITSLLDNDNDITKISNLRKTNLSNIAKDSVKACRVVVLESPIWFPFTTDTLTPRLVALKALDMLLVGLRQYGNDEPLLTQDLVHKLVEIALPTSQRSKVDEHSVYEKAIITLTFSILESVSLAASKQTTWPPSTLRRLADLMTPIFKVRDATMNTLAVKLCMNVTNNRPKACLQFSDAPFVHSLLGSIVDRFTLLQTSLEDVQRTEILDTLILSLGAMINLTEHSDRARTNADDEKGLLETVVTTFVDGSVRTAQALSMEETQASVAVGYLSVLLGNLCLNSAIRTKIRARMPEQQLTILVDKIKEFVQVHEHANRKAKQFEGNEGQETWRNYTARILLVAEELEKVGT
ncbi:hypothetical protein EK21DRAFT_73644 [Setomelanomma holmii]|uniref:Wings apart-like protein C-terminal domain-containing protein n=1 Tax=Setomelanomma holmii TaxID=210430 RepID=A0A9P4LK35_9PLEO|nr:hypothetical protein EK21DRAFT_73644 [Setomelanomma holmii]